MNSSVQVKKKVAFVAQEISLAKILASNDRHTREKGVKKLSKWLKARLQASFQFTEDDLMRVWKGLFYCMWMADKPLVQEEMAENISKLVCITHDTTFVVMFVSCFFHTMSREWLGIDHFRLDKFLMLIRRVVRQLLVFCRLSEWSPQVIDSVGHMFNATVLSGWPARSLTMHFCEIYLVELAKVSKECLSADTVHDILKPFVTYLAREKDPLLRSHVVDHIFHHLIRQSDLGQDCEAKFEAWKMAGFPGSSWKNMEVVESDGSLADTKDREDLVDDDERPSDPRAGSVHVELKQLLFDPAVVAHMLFKERAVTFEVKNRRILKGLADDFTKMFAGHYPLKIVTFGRKNKYISELRESFKRKHHLSKGTKRLLQFEDKLKHKGGKNKNKSEKMLGGK